MGETSRICCVPLACLGLVLSTAWAAGPNLAERGRVLLLQNERTLEGDITLQGGRFSIRRSIGETWVPADQVQFVGQSMEEVYAFLRRRANLRDPDERVKLARWCQFRELREQALEEATAADELRPGNAEIERLVRGIRNSVPAAVAPPSEEPEPPPAVEITPEALSLFCRKVQPILMNTCAKCHATGKGGDFKLTPAHDQNRRATQLNLAAVVGQLRRDALPSSPLLTMAVTVHGGCAQPPLKGRTIPAFKTLEEWAQAAAETLPSTPAAVPIAASRPRPLADPAPLPASVAEPAPALTEPAEPKPTLPPAPTPAVPPDEFDPAIFNRQMHPGK